MNENFEIAKYLSEDDSNTGSGMDRLPTVAIVILNWNGRHFLEKFLPSVMASTYTNKRIIVADNASNDNSIIFLQQYYPRLPELLIISTCG